MQLDNAAQPAVANPVYTFCMNANLDEYKKLPISERIQLIEDIWDSIAAEKPESFALSRAQREELHRRVDAHREDPSTGIPWTQVREKLFRKS